MKNLFLTITALFILALGALGQSPARPAPASPYGGMTTPAISAPACYLGQTVDPVCLDAALQAYFAGAFISMDKADKAWDVASVVYNSDIADAFTIYEEGMALYRGDPVQQQAVLDFYESNIQLAWSNFTIASDAIYATVVAEISALRDVYDAAVALCCVDLGTITDPENMAPQLEPCGMDVGDVNIMCPEGVADPVCIQGCKDAFYISQGILCAEQQADVDQAYETLINALNAAALKLIADGDLCFGDPVCQQAVVDVYNDTFNSVWQDFYDMYFLSSQIVAAQQQVLLNTMFNCMNRCCP